MTFDRCVYLHLLNDVSYLKMLSLDTLLTGPKFCSMTKRINIPKLFAKLLDK